MNTEDLKLLAEYMGLDIDESAKSSEGIVCDSGIPCRSFIYNPLQNNDQLIKLIGMLIHKPHYYIRGGFDINYTVIYSKDGEFVAQGRTLAEAVVKAAIEMVKA